MTNGFVLVDRPRPHVALVTLNRPERMNSMAFDVMVPLKAVIDELTYDNDIRAVVLTGDVSAVEYALRQVTRTLGELMRFTACPITRT